VLTETCARCGATIYLVGSGNHFKWVTNPGKADTWHCGNDPDFPVRTHAPKEVATPVA
jgi:hypothetical protein